MLAKHRRGRFNIRPTLLQRLNRSVGSAFLVFLLYFVKSALYKKNNKTISFFSYIYISEHVNRGVTLQLIALFQLSEWDEVGGRQDSGHWANTVFPTSVWAVCLHNEWLLLEPCSPVGPLEYAVFTWVAGAGDPLLKAAHAAAHVPFRRASDVRERELSAIKREESKIVENCGSAERLTPDDNHQISGDIPQRRPRRTGISSYKNQHSFRKHNCLFNFKVVHH